MVPRKGKTYLNLLNQQKRRRRINEKRRRKKFSRKGLKECNVCHEIKRSACNKASCVIDGKKPKMMTTATAMMRGILVKVMNTILKRKVKWRVVKRIRMMMITFMLIPPNIF